MSKDVRSNSVDSINISIGNKIRELRAIHRLQQSDLAEFLDVVPSTISNLERGKQTLKVPQMMQLLDLFGVHVCEFLGVAPPKKLTEKRRNEMIIRQKELKLESEIRKRTRELEALRASSSDTRG